MSIRRTDNRVLHAYTPLSGQQQRHAKDLRQSIRQAGSLVQQQEASHYEETKSQLGIQTQWIESLTTVSRQQSDLLHFGIGDIQQSLAPILQNTFETSNMMASVLSGLSQLARLLPFPVQSPCSIYVRLTVILLHATRLLTFITNGAV